MMRPDPWAQVQRPPVKVEHTSLKLLWSYQRTPQNVLNFLHFNYSKSNQCLAELPLLLMTALTREGVDCINFKKNALGNSSHILHNTWNSASALDGCVVLLRSFCLIAPQTFSIGLRSGIWTGYFIIVMLLENRYSDIDLAFCGLQLSCWKSTWLWNFPTIPIRSENEEI